MKKIKFIVVAVLIGGSLLGGYFFWQHKHHVISHPPTFQQFKEASICEYCDYGLILEALEYTENEVNILLKQNDIDFIIGAAIHCNGPNYSKIIRQSPISLLTQNLSRVEDSPEGLSLLINLVLEDELNHKVKVDELIERLIYIDPQNSYPYYIKAYYFNKLENAEQCLVYIAKGNKKKNFNSYYKELHDISIKSSIYLGYSEYAAQEYFRSTLIANDNMLLRELSNFLMEEVQGPEYLIECKKMLSKFKRNSISLISEICSFVRYKKVIRKLNDKDEELESLEKEIDRIDMVLNMYNDYVADNFEALSDVSEKRMLGFYNDHFSNSYTYAWQKLMEEYPLTKLDGK